jgi:ribose-phosphate pyrophosphokinase
MIRKPLVIGFRDDAALLMSAGRLMGVEPSLAKEGRYPAGELTLTVPASVPAKVLVVGLVREEPASLTRLLFLAQALRSAGARSVVLMAPWIAYGRQDRVTEPGGCPAGIAVAKALALAFDRIVTLDAHSVVFIKAFGSKLRNVTVDEELFAFERVDAIAAPDAGATSRANALAKELGLPKVQIEKKRESIRIQSRVTSKLPKDFLGARVVLIDDLAESGQTLIAASRALKETGARTIGAYVSHAMDLAKLQDRLRNDVSPIEALYDHASGRLATSALQRLIAEAL